jgi:16S rRNA (adenine1518-N6/adenine1519-N6)-dimethyltransferase
MSPRRESTSARAAAGLPRPAPDFVRERAAREGSELSRLKAALAARGLAPRKRWGQNFLVREDLAARIVDHCHVKEDDVVVEIGPGAGALTPMLARRARHVIAVEKDAGLAEYLREELGALPRLEVVEGDFLEFDLGAAARSRGTEQLAVVGNIPYHITTPILLHLFEQRAAVRVAVLLVQKEYAERLGAAADTPAYGALTLYARYHAQLEPLMHVRASAFWPRPEVDSTLVRFFMRPVPPVDIPSQELLFRIVRGAFQQRRKQLGNTLMGALEADRQRVTSLCRAARVDARRRGETLTLEEFARLAWAAVEVGLA